jgi:hypothetical protein
LGLVLVAGIGIALMLAGSLGPWADVANRDGLITLALAVIAAVLLRLRVRLAVIGCATVALTVVLYDLLAIGDADGVTVGWGLWVCLAGTLVLAAGVTVIRR